MQKFVVKKSKSAPLAASSSQPAQLKPTLCGAEKTVPPNATTATALNSTESSTIVCKSDVTANKPVIKSVAATASSTSSSSASVMPISQTTSVPAPSTTVSHVKMSGYLKKKRNVRANFNGKKTCCALKCKTYIKLKAFTPNDGWREKKKTK